MQFGHFILDYTWGKLCFAHRQSARMIEVEKSVTIKEYPLASGELWLSNVNSAAKSCELVGHKGGPALMPAT